MTKRYLLTLLLAVLVGYALYFGNKTSLQSKDTHPLGEKKENKNDGPREFLKFHLAIRTRADQSKPAYPNNYQLKELQKARADAFKKSSSARTESGNGVIEFIERGPGNVPGRTRGLIVDPDDPTHKTWFAGSASGGIWKTTDGGTSWQWLTSSLPNLSTTTLAMAVSNHDIIYAGTGEGFGLIDGVTGGGIFKTIDKGNSWALLNNSSFLGDINRIIVSPSDPTTVIAATNKGIYKSIDGGTNWTNVFEGIIQDIRSTPSNFNILYATQNQVGVIKSTDAGSSWSLSNSGMAPGGRVEIDISPVQTNRMIASCEGTLSGTNSDLYVSDDGGVTWYLVTLSLAGKTVDYLGAQGWYDNTVAFSPYNQNIVYIGGIGVYQVTLGSVQTGTVGTYTIKENKTSSFISLQNFGATYYGGKLEVGSAVNKDSIEIRFGAGLKQKANRFLVPVNATSGVTDANYSYQDYVEVPFEVWDVTKNQQLMVSFRDQNRNGIFDLIYFNNSDTSAVKQSREYIFIHSIKYDANNPSTSLAKNGGQAINRMYFIWPTLKSGATWTPNSLPSSRLQFYFQNVNKYSSTVTSVADAYSQYDGKNNSNFVHPDQHNILPIKQNDVLKTFQLLLANDGGLFVSGTSTSPGTTQGEWKKIGNGYNTSQFYGADKKPGAQEYIGGMQDNSTYFTPSGIISSAGISFKTNTKLAGDGFDALWHSQNSNKMIGSSQYNSFARSLDGGTTWSSAIAGLTLSGGTTDQTKYQFLSKLANSKQAPDNLYTVGTDGVWRSTDFGGSWKLTSIDNNWALDAITFADVQVSRANANIIWAGSGLGSRGSIFVSTNTGKSFAKVNDAPGYILGNITRLSTHPTEEKTAYALFSFAKTAKILKTSDLGQTWNDISGFGIGTSSNNGFPDVAVYSLYVRPDNPNIIWAGTEIGIVESLDGGNSWALLSGFPNVPVWEMKGQDNEIIIATHGRGIWTAKLAIDQNLNFPVPQILVVGTSPQSKFLLKVTIPSGYDSTQVMINSHVAGSIISAKDTLIVTLENLIPGSITAQLISYKGTSPVYSLPVTASHLKLQSYQDHFYDYFANGSNFSLIDLSVKTFGTSNSSLQSLHSYNSQSDASAILLAPIIVSGTNSTVLYQDVALVQPSANGSVFGQASFNDFVVMEATKDGLNWIPISDGYNASAHATWSSAFNSNASGSLSMMVSESVDLRNKFAPKDTLLIRFRLHANSDATTGWGWAVDNLYIQQQPTEVEANSNTDLTLYPNPSSGIVKAKFFLEKTDNIKFQIWDITGRSILTRELKEQSGGYHEEEFDLNFATEGIYILKATNSSQDKTIRFMIKR